MAHLRQKWFIFSTSDPILFIIHEPDLFWYIITHMEYEILNELQNDSIELKFFLI